MKYLLTAANRLLAQLAFGNVVIRADESVDMALRIQKGLSAHQQPLDLRVGRRFHGDELVPHCPALQCCLADRMFIQAQQRALFVEHLPLAPVAVVDVLDARIIIQFEYPKKRLVDDREYAVFVDQCHCRLKVLDQHPELLLALLQRLGAFVNALFEEIVGLVQHCFGALELFDVGACAKPFLNLAVLVAHRFAAD